VFQAAVTVD